MCHRRVTGTKSDFADLIETAEVLDFVGERAGTRTLDLLIKSQLLYRLSYALALDHQCFTAGTFRRGTDLALPNDGGR